jgi:DNA repair photolyase
MTASATLPLFPDLALPGRPRLDAPPLRRRSGVELLDLVARDVLNRAESPRLPFQWTLNPYRGCEFGCAYCYARATHAYFELSDPVDPLDFETRIFVKRGAAARLRRQLVRHDLRGQTIAIGTATDPYQPAEKQFEITRSLLEVFLDTEGLTLALTTKSPLVVRDLELLAELDRRHAVEVHVTVTTVDPELARRIEVNAPDPRARLRTVERLAEAGIATRVNCMPVMPGINDDEETLGPLLDAASAAGAHHVTAQPLFLKPGMREFFFGWIEREFPSLRHLYRRLYARRDYLDDDAKERLLTVFRRLRLERGFPRPVAGRT